MLEYISFLLGVFVPFGLLCVVLLFAKVFDKFWFWTFVYTKDYASTIPLSAGVENFKKVIFWNVHSSILLWGLAGIGLTALLWDKKVRPHGVFVVAFFIFSFLSVCPGFYFYPHYFILCLPAIALLAGIAISSVGRLLSNTNISAARMGIPILLAIVAILYSVFAEREYLFRASPDRISRMTYGANPFPESIAIAEYIKEHTSANDRIAVLGSEPQIYFYSGRRSATRYIFTYPLMAKHDYALKMQQEMIREIESARPEFLIFVAVATSWLVRPESEKLIFNWSAQYVQKYYKRVGVVDILSPEPTMFYWDDESIGYSPRSDYWLSIFKREKK